MHQNTLGMAILLLSLSAPVIISSPCYLKRSCPHWEHVFPSKRCVFLLQAQGLSLFQLLLPLPQRGAIALQIFLQLLHLVLPPFRTRLGDLLDTARNVLFLLAAIILLIVQPISVSTMHLHINQCALQTTLAMHIPVLARISRSGSGSQQPNTGKLGHPPRRATSSQLKQRSPTIQSFSS